MARRARPAWRGRPARRARQESPAPPDAAQQRRPRRSGGRGEPSRRRGYGRAWRLGPAGIGPVGSGADRRRRRGRRDQRPARAAPPATAARLGADVGSAGVAGADGVTGADRRWVAGVDGRPDQWASSAPAATHHDRPDGADRPGGTTGSRRRHPFERHHHRCGQAMIVGFGGVATISGDTIRRRAGAGLRRAGQRDGHVDRRLLGAVGPAEHVSGPPMSVGLRYGRTSTATRCSSSGRQVDVASCSNAIGDPITLADTHRRSRSPPALLLVFTAESASPAQFTSGFASAGITIRITLHPT